MDLVPTDAGPAGPVHGQPGEHSSWSGETRRSRVAPCLGEVFWLRSCREARQDWGVPRPRPGRRPRSAPSSSRSAGCATVAMRPRPAERCYRLDEAFERAEPTRFALPLAVPGVFFDGSLDTNSAPSRTQRSSASSSRTSTTPASCHRSTHPSTGPPRTPTPRRSSTTTSTSPGAWPTTWPSGAPSPSRSRSTDERVKPTSG